MDDGARQLRMLARDLEKAGKELPRQLPKALKRASVPLVEAIRAEAEETLPHRGGFAGYVARASITTQVRTGVNTASVRIVGRKRQSDGTRQVDLPAINRGRLRHLVYGHHPWVTQRVREGFWDHPVERSEAVVAKAVQGALDDVRRLIETGH